MGMKSGQYAFAAMIPPDFHGVVEIGITPNTACFPRATSVYCEICVDVGLYCCNYAQTPILTPLVLSGCQPRRQPLTP